MALIKLEPLDWRYSSAIVGISRYLSYHSCDYILTEDYIEFEDEDIFEERYLEFVEKYFKESMHHIAILENLEISYDDESKETERVKLINEKLKANTILKNLFSKIKYDGENSEEIVKVIEDNKTEIIKNTYKGGRSLYYNFCNPNQLLNKKGKVCRINGYSIDMGKKSKGNSYKQDAKTFVYNDSEYFDFIPFGFSKDREAFFINCNVDLKKMVMVNNVDFRPEERNTLRSEILLNLGTANSRIEFDVEVIVKDREKDFFETLFIRQEAIDIFKNIKEETKVALKYPCNIGKISGFSSSEYIPVEKIVTDSILNLLSLDNLIEFLLKNGTKKYLVSHLISINILIYKGVKEMYYQYKQAREDAAKIRVKLPENKIRTYEQRLVTAISLKDYDRVKEVLLHLSSTAQLPIRALIPLCYDFEANKNLAYIFINCLGDKEGYSGKIDFESNQKNEEGAK
ncbi:MAG: type I CRISPR-associated protein Cas8a1/Csx8 [Cetobacterium sp.]